MQTDDAVIFIAVVALHVQAAASSAGSRSGPIDIDASSSSRRVVKSRSKQNGFQNRIRFKSLILSVLVTCNYYYDVYHSV